MNNILLILTLLISTSAYSFNEQNKVLVISDIDDTIKVSHILGDLSYKLVRAADTRTPFMGMAPLLQWIVASNKAQNNQENSSVKVVYLSNAPEEIMGVPAMLLSHQTFLANNNFPEGELSLRDSLFDKNHKINEIHRLINAERPDTVIFIGDNGERDPEIYHQAYLDFKNSGIKIFTFIHQLYRTSVPFYQPEFLSEMGSKIYSEQIGYATAIEIALYLRSTNLITTPALKWMLQKVAPAVVSEKMFKIDRAKPLAFPAFMNCSDFKWRWNDTQVYAELATAERNNLNMLIKKINSRCD